MNTELFYITTQKIEFWVKIMTFCFVNIPPRKLMTFGPRSILRQLALQVLQFEFFQNY